MNVKESAGKNGLENAELLAAQLNYIKCSVLRAIFKHPNSWPFHKPVDVVQLDLPDYYSIIKKPMDMGTMQQKIDNQQYSSAQECVEDFKLMCANCYLYNGPNDEVVIMCREIEDIFDKKMAKMPTELNHVKRGRGRTSLPGPGPGPVPSPAPISNGSAASNTPNAVLHVKKEPKVVPPSASLVPATPKFLNAVDHSQLMLDAPSLTAVTAVTNVSAGHTPATLETNSFVGGSSMIPSSKTKKTVKRKADDNSPMHAAPETPRSTLSQPIANPQPAAVGERRENSSRSGKRAKRESVESQSQHPGGIGSRKQLTEALAYCHDILLQLFQKPLSTVASHFYNCVDPKGPGMESYFDIIKRPMNLVTIKKNLESDVYHRSSEFAKDMRQIFTNCYRFFSPDEDIVRAAKTVQDFFELNFAKAPDDPPEIVSPAMPTAASNCGPVLNQAKMEASDSEESSSESVCSEDNDSDQEKREAKLKLLQDQLFQVQQEVMRLSQHIEKGKKKKSKKPQEKFPEVALNVPEPPVALVAKPAAEPAVRTPAVKPTKPARTKLPSQKKTAGSKAVPRPAAAKTASANIPEPILPPQPQTSVHLSHEEQNQLREDIGMLPEDAQYSILQIIRNQGTSLNVSGDEIVIDFETLKPSTIMEMRAFVTQCSKDNFDKKFEPEKHLEELVDILSDEEQRKSDKIGTLDNSPVHPVGHLLPQQPLRPSTTATPKPPPRTLNVPSASSFGSQAQQSLPEFTFAISPPTSAAAAAAAADSKQGPLNLDDPISPPPPVLSQESAFPKYGGLADQKTLPNNDRWLEDAPVANKPISVPPPPVRSSSALDRPVSPSAASSLALSRRPSSKSLVGNGEDSSSPKTVARPGSSFMSLGANTKHGPPAMGPFGVDMPRPMTQKESTPKPSMTGWSFAGLAANTQSSSTPKPVSQQQTNALQFNRFKRIAAERQERERLNQEKEAMKQQRQRMEEEVRDRKRKEDLRSRDDDDSSAAKVSIIAEPRLTAGQTSPAAAAAVETKAKDNQLSEQQQERLREQQRRRMEAQSNKIDMNFQSDLLASFESNFRLNSTL